MQCSNMVSCLVITWIGIADHEDVEVEPELAHLRVGPEAINWVKQDDLRRRGYN